MRSLTYVDRTMHPLLLRNFPRGEHHPVQREPDDFFDLFFASLILLAMSTAL